MLMPRIAQPQVHGGAGNPPKQARRAERAAPPADSSRPRGGAAAPPAAHGAGELCQPHGDLHHGAAARRVCNRGGGAVQMASKTSWLPVEVSMESQWVSSIASCAESVSRWLSSIASHTETCIMAQQLEEFSVAREVRPLKCLECVAATVWGGWAGWESQWLSQRRQLHRGLRSAQRVCVRSRGGVSMHEHDERRWWLGNVAGHHQTCGAPFGRFYAQFTSPCPSTPQTLVSWLMC